MKTKHVYVSVDGKTFQTRKECEEYEMSLDTEESLEEDEDIVSLARLNENEDLKDWLKKKIGRPRKSSYFSCLYFVLKESCNNQCNRT